MFFSAYHAVKRSKIIKNLLQTHPVLEPEQLLLMHGLYADTLWVEALELGLAPVRFRPSINTVWLTTNFVQALQHNSDLTCADELANSADAPLAPLAPTDASLFGGQSADTVSQGNLVPGSGLHEPDTTPSNFH